MTNRIIFALMILSFQQIAGAAEFKWHRDLGSAAKQAAELDRPLLVKVGASWCGACVRMDRTTFASTSVRERLAAGFVAVNVDADRYPSVVSRFGVSSYPTTLLLSPEQSVITRMSGIWSATSLTAALDKLRPFKKAEPTEGETPTGKPITKSVSKEAKRTPLGFDGFCLVSMLDDRDYRKGLSGYTTTHKGLVLRFRSRTHLERFLAAPEKYWPANDGRSPIASDSGDTKVGSARLAMVFRDRLYFFLSRDEQAAFREKPAQYATN